LGSTDPHKTSFLDTELPETYIRGDQDAGAVTGYRKDVRSRIDTPSACYLIVSLRWLSSGACLTIVIL
jgi:hypothetical protein